MPLHEWSLFFLLTFFGILLKGLIIDTRIIMIKNDVIYFIPWVFPLLAKRRNMTYYDGYVRVEEFNPNGRNWEAIYLIKRGFIVGRISEFYYQNFQEIESAIGVRELHFKKVNWFKQILVSAFGLPVPL